MKPPSAELRELLDRLLDQGGLSRSEMGRLEELMTDPEAMAYCCETLLNESLLPDAIATMETAMVHAREMEKDVLRTGGKKTWWRRCALAAAAVVLFGAGMVTDRWFAPPPATVDRVGIFSGDGVEAKVTGMMGVVWREDSHPDIADGAVPARRVAFESGLVELTYGSGVRVTLEGPADFTVSDATSGKIANGKLVAYVPKGAEGFVVDYGNGQVVDLGTEFAMELAEDGKMELGVFEGEVELHLPGDVPLLLNRSQAMVHDRNADEPVRPVPFDRAKYVRQLPNRDFPWTVNDSQPEPLEWDVSHLVWKSAEYRAVFKWISGKDAVDIRGVELRLDGKVVAADSHDGRTGMLPHARDNLFELTVPPGEFHPGRWTLHAVLRQLPRSGGMESYRGPVESSGIVLFEEGLVNRAQASEFIGRWAYTFAGARFIREFHPDGSITLTKNGVRNRRAFANCRWWVEDGILHAPIPGPDGFVELHALRNRETLIFINREYDNASRLTNAAAAK